MAETVSDRERTARRLLTSSAEKFYDPEVDIDWDAPWVEGMPFLPDHRITLFGTETWERMTPQQRFELGKHEAVSMVSYGIYAEAALMHILLRLVTEGDPATPRTRYTLTEIGDECRHSTMFARFIEKTGIRAYRQPRLAARGMKFISLLPIGPASYGLALLIEEILDRGQREVMIDEDVQPHMRMLTRIHVLEEARHITFARSELVASAERLNRLELTINRFVLAIAANLVAVMLIHPRVYIAVGIRPRDGRKLAMGNEHYRKTLAFMAEKLIAFFEESGMLKGRVIRALWHRSKLLPKDAR